MIFKALTQEFVNAHSAPENFAKLEHYVEMIEQKNKSMNLTGWTGDRLWEEGIYESIILLFAAFKNPQDASMVDIGAGAGFPSVPFKIIFPELNLTIIEPQQKRVNFLAHVSKELDLDINIIVARAEDVVDKTFTLITARAVAPLYALLEISSRLGHEQSHFAFLKGPSIDEELIGAEGIIKKLKIDYQILESADSHLERKNRIFSYIKTSDTPEGVPRPWAQIVK